jgi:hypothetical protein
MSDASPKKASKPTRLTHHHMNMIEKDPKHRFSDYNSRSSFNPKDNKDFTPCFYTL